MRHITLSANLLFLQCETFEGCIALKSVNIPTIEVHLSNIYTRESYRQISFIKEVAFKSFVGLGFEGYKLAIEEMVEFLKGERK